MPSVHEIVECPAVTTVRGLKYVFTPKHHGADMGAACWLTELPFEEEFAVFDRADGAGIPDRMPLADEDGNLYGCAATADGGLRALGLWGEQLAEFPAQGPDAGWHGYPIYPVDATGPPNRQGHKCRPTAAALRRLEAAGVITPAQRKRLGKGRFV